ncbi:MAG: DUF4465 domain-containing protein [Bacteroidales bacterium]|nr:DUF4465 domain-containing protein [Bacteroidales bacterium]
MELNGALKTSPADNRAGGIVTNNDLYSRLRAYKLSVRMIKPFIMILLCFQANARAQTRSDFEGLLTDPSTYWNGSDNSYGSYNSLVKDSVFLFSNSFIRYDYGYGLYESWSGMAYSRMKDDTTAGFFNQYSAVTAGGASGSDNYAVFCLVAGNDTVKLTHPSKLDSVFITNGTYPYLSMRDGDMFAKKFGGESGNDPDWFLLSIKGLRNEKVTDTVEFYLADYRDSQNENDYIVDCWTKIDLSVLDTVDMIEFSLSSSDTGTYGMNTPAYFCMDNLSGASFDALTFVSGDYWNGQTACFGQYPSAFANGLASFPNVYSINDYGFGPYESWAGFAYSNMQDSITAGFSNQYSAFPAEGANGSSCFSLCYNLKGADTIKLIEVADISGAFITNGTYNVISMREGDAFAKKFGGESGTDPDWFLLTIRGILEGICTDTVEFYLADYRFENSASDYIVTEWTWVDFSALGEVDMIEFSLSSSDNGLYGMNTPAYFFLDDLNDQSPLVASPIADITVEENASDEVIDLSGVFTDADNEDNAISLTVKSNSSESLVNAGMSDFTLTLSFSENMSGSATIVIEAVSNGQRITDEFTVTITPVVGIEEMTYKSVNVFPNPTTGPLTVKINQKTDVHAELYGLFGQKLKDYIITNGKTETDIKDLAPGVYIMIIHTAKGIVTKRIIKQ